MNELVRIWKQVVMDQSIFDWILCQVSKRTGWGSNRTPLACKSGTLLLDQPVQPEAKNAMSYAFTPPYIFTAWYLIKHRNNSAFILVICGFFYDDVRSWDPNYEFILRKVLRWMQNSPMGRPNWHEHPFNMYKSFAFYSLVIVADPSYIASARIA
jgi:hypothetical protein